MAFLNREAQRLHYQDASPAQQRSPLFVFASRNASTHTRRKLVNEAQVLNTIRRLLRAYNRPEQLVVYNGHGVDYADQYELFSKATIIMGAHGSALSNVLWTKSQSGCPDPVQVIEIVGGVYSGPQVQATYNSYYWLETAVPWVSYHMLTLEANSTRLNTSVSLVDVQAVLSRIWGGAQNGSATSCYMGIRH